jgi:hypothetical protein
MFEIGVVKLTHITNASEALEQQAVVHYARPPR